MRLFVTNSLRGAMDVLIPRFERESGHRVQTSYDPAKTMLARVRRGESADVAVLGGTAVDELIREGVLDGGTRRAVARCGVGLAVRAGAPKPDIGTVERLKQALLAAPSIAWTQEGASGMYFSKLIEQLGIASEIVPKGVREPGGLIGELVAEGRAALAVQQIPELLAVPGIELIGPLPPEVQVITTSYGAVFRNAAEPAAARAFLDFLGTPGSVTVLREKGHEPVS